ncbi:MAG TPA: hypothetical protein DCY80_13265, partial [Solibacterales bacterium]|nr:hypothetical protein [Bryobacterales bacterium]
MTQPRPTFALLLGLFALLAAPTPATPQASPPPDEDFIVYSDSPRLLLNSRRLRLMQRERERESMRWLQFEALMNGNAVMPEPGFARALFGIITARREPCKSAAAWAASDAANPNTPAHARQIALVYDWCLDSLDGADANALTRRLQTILSQRPAAPAHVRSVVFAAIALADIEPKASQDTLRWAANSWWRASILPALARGEFPFASRADLFAMVEFLHAFRDNLRIDLREGAEKWFEELPPRLLLNYYPLPWPAAENEFRIPAFDGNSEPDLREAALARAAELALVA